MQKECWNQSRRGFKERVKFVPPHENFTSPPYPSVGLQFCAQFPQPRK
jgi:hypothetical protein